MALRSDQATVLRRRVVGGMVRNLALFSLAFLLVCVAFQIGVVPTLAAAVADSTSSWRILNSSAELEPLLEVNDLTGSAAFDSYVDDFAAEGCSTEPGSLSGCLEAVNSLADAIAAYANGDFPPYDIEWDDADFAISQEGTEGEVVTDASGEGLEQWRLGKDGLYRDITDETPNDLSGGDGSSAAASSGELDAADGAPTTSVPLVSYEDILAAEGIEPPEASAAQALAALRCSASIQELGLSLSVPAGAPDINTTAVLAQASGLGLSGDELAALFDASYRDSQQEAYQAWRSLAPADQAAALGLSATDPIWQVETNAQGTYEIRDIAVYTFVKSFKIPLAILLFVAGWLVIMFRALNQSLRYFDELSGAVGKLLAHKDAPIELPADLSIARNELSVIRAQSLADERAAQAAEQRKNELVAYLAHDIRTPLTSVLGYLDLLRETTDLPRDVLRRYADIAYTKAERLESLINEFFEITRYNLSAIPIERETVGVRLFCQQVAEAFFPEASARHIRISVDATACETFYVDPDKLARALGNVMRNAVAYAEGGTTIALAARQDASTTTITVANRGREISKAHLETIFEKFYREDGARSSKSGGAGLGLAIAREIVVAHQGDITAQSTQGVTVFTLTLPTGTTGAAATAPLLPATARGARLGAPLPPDNEAGSQRKGNVTSESPGTARPDALKPSRLNPRYARHGRPSTRAAVRDNGATKRIRPSRRHS